MADWDNQLPHDTPKRAKVRGAIEYMEARGIPHSKADVFRYYGVSKRQGWAMISEGSVDRRHHNTEGEERRGRPPIITQDQIKEMDRILQEVGFEARQMSWVELGYEVGLEGVHSDTIKRAMGSMDYHQCIACRKGWASKKLAAQRVEFSHTQLDLRPTSKDWRVVRFSDEVHFAIGPQGKIYVIRKPGERYCNACIQHKNEPIEEEKEIHKIHSWAAVGYDFKSELVFYIISSNKNGKMTQRAYIDQILEPVVKPWLGPTQPAFILEEDNDSGHGPSASNIVRTWKEKNSLQHYFNCPSSPDLAPIENCWQPPKQYVKKFPHWDESDTRELALEGWERVTQKFINERVDSMPERLQACIDAEGQPTGY